MERQRQGLGACTVHTVQSNNKIIISAISFGRDGGDKYFSYRYLYIDFGAI